jgi:hypothetical protein
MKKENSWFIVQDYSPAKSRIFFRFFIYSHNEYGYECIKNFIQIPATYCQG